MRSLTHFAAPEAGEHDEGSAQPATGRGLRVVTKSATKSWRQCSHGGPGGGWSSCATSVASSTAARQQRAGRMVVTVAGQQMHGVIHRRSSPAPGDAAHRVARQCGQIWSGSGGFGVNTIGEPVVRFSGTNSAPHRPCTLRVTIEYVPQWVPRSDIERKYQPLTRATGSTRPSARRPHPLQASARTRR